MIRIQNEIIAMTCDENGQSLSLTDKKRGMRWVLDPQSLGYGALMDGIHVTANFSLDFVGSEKGVDHRTAPGAGVLPPEGWRVD